MIARGRQEGKTTELIRIAAAEGLYVVTHTHREAYRLAREAETAGLSMPFPLLFGEEFLPGRYHAPGVRGVVIDNLDLCVAGVSKVPVRAVSLTVPAESGIWR